MVSCGRQPVPEQTSTPHFDIDLPKDEVPSDNLRAFMDDLSALAINQISEVTVAEMVEIARLPEEFAPYIDLVLAKRNEMVSMQCEGLKCQAVNSGESFEFTIEEVDVPVLGKPKVTVGETVTFNYRFNEELQVLEACRIKGIKVKSGFLKPALDGAYVELDINDVVQELKADVSVGGSYPSKDCDF
jgi:hypothetical protein